MEFRILGPLQAVAGDRNVELPPMLRRLLAVLLLEANRVVPSPRLTQLIWDDPPRGAENTLRSHVHRLRHLLTQHEPSETDSTVIVNDKVGYKLPIAGGQLDSLEFQCLVDRGRKALDGGDPTAAAESLDSALSLWRGPLLADLPDLPFVLEARQRFQARLLVAQETRLKTLVELGSHTDAIGAAQEILTADPNHDGVRVMLALSLYRTGRHQDAAQACRDGLERASEQGLSSPPMLQELQRKILQHAPELEWSPVHQSEVLRDHISANRERAGVAERALEVWHVPVPRQRWFTGRRRELDRLSDRFDGGERIQAISGIGGIGKTQLAAQYAHRKRSHYRVIWWISATEPSTIASQLAALAARLDLPAAKHADQKSALVAVQQWLQSNGGWLLIFDDARSPAAVQGALPDTDFGHVLITSTNPNWTNIARTRKLRSLARRASVKLLTAEIEVADQASAQRLAKSLHDLPLALQQARSYVTATGRSLGHYLELFEQRPNTVLADSHVPSDYQRAVAATWEMAIEQVKRAAPSGTDLVNLCSMLAPEDAPLDLLLTESSIDLLPPPLARLATDAFEHDGTLAALQTYSLIEIRSGGVSMHQLLQSVIRGSLDKPDDWAILAAQLVRRALPSDADLELNWPTYQRLMPSLLSTIEHPAVADREPNICGWLLDRAATWLQKRGQFEDAERFFRRAYAVRRDAFGHDDPRTINSLNNLGLLMTHLDIDQARELLSQALAGHSDLVANSDRDEALAVGLADGLNNLGWVEHLAGNDIDGIHHLDKALQTYKMFSSQDGKLESLGPVHAWINRGVCMLTLRRHRDAEQSFLQALERLREGGRVGGSEEATIWNNLAVLALAQGDTHSALAHHEKALEVRRHALGRRHPTTGTSLMNLGATYREIGQASDTLPPLEKALDLHHAALDIFCDVFGSDHRETAQAINNIGLDLRSYGRVLRANGEADAAHDRFNQAERRLRSAYATRRRLYSPPHPELIQSMDNIGAVLRDLGRYNEAISMHEESLAMRFALEGETSIAASSTLEHLALARERAGRSSAARRDARRAIDLLTDASGGIRTGFERLGERLSSQLERLTLDQE